MSRKTKSLLVLTLAFCLLLGAAAPARASGAPDDGKTLRYEGVLRVDGSQVMALARKGVYMEPAALPLLTVLSDLRVSGLLAPGGFSFALGSDKGRVIEGSLTGGVEGGAELMLSLLPGYAVAVLPDPAGKRQAVQTPPPSPEELRQMLGAYWEAVARAFADRVMADAGIKTGKAAETNIGSFASRRDFVFDSRDMGALLRAVLEQFKADKRAQELLMAAVEAGWQAESLDPNDGFSADSGQKKPTAEDLIVDFSRQVAELETREAEEGFRVSLFQSEDLRESYARIAAAEGVDPQVFVTLRVSAPSADAFSLKLTLLEPGGERMMGSDDDAVWDAVLSKMAGQSAPEDTLVNLSLDISRDGAENRQKNRLTAAVKTRGQAVTVTLAGYSSLADGQETRQTLSVFLDSQEPLITLEMSAEETDEPFSLEKPAGVKTLVIDGSFPEDEARVKALVKSIFLALPDLLMRIQTAFPEAYEQVVDQALEASF